MTFIWRKYVNEKMHKKQKCNRIKDRFMFTPSGNVLAVKKNPIGGGNRKTASTTNKTVYVTYYCHTVYMYVQQDTYLLGLVSQSVYLCIQYKIDILNAVATTWPTMQLRCATLASSAAAWTAKPAEL